MKNFEPKDLLFLDKMVTPAILNVLYWILGVLVILGGVMSIISGGFIQGILIIPFGLLYLRVMMELLTVMFKINANVGRIADKDKQ